MQISGMNHFLAVVVDLPHDFADFEVATKEHGY